MSDESALLAAILAQPEEDTPRLVYADWLDEHGDAAGRARAEFIRLQIELARSGLTDRRRKGAEDRCLALSREHHEAWLAPFRAACADEPIAGTFRRGFIGDISGLTRLPSRFPAIAAVCPVQRVDIEFGWAAHTPSAQAMADCPELARVRRMECRRFPGDFGATALASPHLTGLHTLYLQWGWLEDGVELASRSPVAQSLRHLWVWGASVGQITPGRGFGTIVEAEWPALTQVRFDNLALGEAGVLAVMRAAVARGWQAVHAHDRGLTAAGATTALWVALASDIASVSLAVDCDIKEPPEPVPDGVKSLRLYAFDNAGDEVARWVVANVPPGRFNRLGLRRCHLPLATVRLLAKWDGLAHLTELDLRECQINDAGAEALAESPHLEKVERLLVARNGFAKKGKDALKKRFARRVRVSD
jgi:uncharacterized protein (TIGR02996 family)